jgi:hypothetical protein
MHKALEIPLLTLGAALVRAIALRFFKRWTTRLNWEHKHFLVALVERMITPILVIAVVSVAFLSTIRQASDRTESFFLCRRSRHWHLLRCKSCADSLKPVD